MRGSSIIGAAIALTMCVCSPAHAAASNPASHAAKGPTDVSAQAFNHDRKRARTKGAPPPAKKFVVPQRNTSKKFVVPRNTFRRPVVAPHGSARFVNKPFRQFQPARRMDRRFRHGPPPKIQIVNPAARGLTYDRRVRFVDPRRRIIGVRRPGRLPPVGGPGLVRPVAAGVAGAAAGAVLGNATLINNRRVTIYRQPRMFWRGNTIVRLIAVGALGTIVVGGAQYIPDGYVIVPRPACGGVTPEGCSLRWQAVPTMDGGSEAQCVQYCPPGRAEILDARLREIPQGSRPLPPAAEPEPPPALAPAQAVAAVPPVQMQQPPAQGCEVAIYNGLNFSGEAVRTNDSQPNLNDQWNRQIASLQVIAGTWDFFKGEDFSGEAMRLAPGEYGDLGGAWARQIGSFMCSEPGQ